jgi:hypothetical protein
MESNTHRESSKKDLIPQQGLSLEVKKSLRNNTPHYSDQILGTLCAGEITCSAVGILTRRETDEEFLTRVYTCFKHVALFDNKRMRLKSNSRSCYTNNIQKLCLLSDRKCDYMFGLKLAIIKSNTS